MNKIEWRLDNMQNFLELNDNYNEEKKTHIFDDVEIIVDPELEDESTIDINNYMNKFILQCRICGNLFPSEELLDDDSECPICDSKSPNGFIFKGKLKHKQDDKSSKKEDSINDLAYKKDGPGHILTVDDLSNDEDNDLSNTENVEN